MSQNVKTGFSFPLLVIAGALAIGGVGFYVLYRMYEKDDAIIRGTSSLGSVEGKLIEELQRRTSAEMALRDTVITLQQEQIDGILARKPEVRGDPAETARLEREIAEREKTIADLEAEKTEIMENYWKQLALHIPPDTPAQTAIDHLWESDWVEIPFFNEPDQSETEEDASVQYEQIIDQLTEEKTRLTRRLDEKDREIGRLSAENQALRMSRLGMNE